MWHKITNMFFCGDFELLQGPYEGSMLIEYGYNLEVIFQEVLIWYETTYLKEAIVVSHGVLGMGLVELQKAVYTLL